MAPPLPVGFVVVPLVPPAPLPASPVRVAPGLVSLHA